MTKVLFTFKFSRVNNSNEYNIVSVEIVAYATAGIIVFIEPLGSIKSTFRFSSKSSGYNLRHMS